MTLKIGDIVGVACKVTEGPFEEEFMVEIQTSSGPITGFARSKDLKQVNGAWRIRGTLVAVRDGEAKVKIEGSFFSTNGLANFPVNEVRQAA